jgi:HTH-type transcriptional regulator, competence development regulator
MDTLGKTLKNTRENVSLTLRDVEIATGISNAYLSQLENEKIKKPSASILYKLANVYKIELNVLLYASGIIEKNDQTDSKPKQSLLEREIAFYKDKLSEDEEKEIVDFIKFLRYKKGNDATF